MYADELEKVTVKMNRMFAKKTLEGKKIYLFGVSDNTRQIIKILRENGYEPQNVVDNDVRKQGSYCAGLKVVSPDDVEVDKKSVWLLYSFYWIEMKFYLLNKGYLKKQIIPLVQKDSPIFCYIHGAKKGKRFYECLKRDYGDVPIFLCPYTGTGDIYLIGTFWKEYIEKNKITDYVFIVISNACKKTAMLFDIKNIVLLKDQKMSGHLIAYYNLCPNKDKIKILNDAWAQVNDNLSEWFRGYKGLYFTELFRKWVFDLSEKSVPVHPVFKDASEEVDRIFKENDLVAGKTVVLSPYSNTLSDLPMSFWKGICSKLKEKGYVVCTNSSGPSEPAVDGSKAVFFPLNIAPQFVSCAGGFIGVRSGFCDIISGADAKKVILYDSGNRFYNCSAFEYFSLKLMGLSNDSMEIEYHNDSIDDVTEKINEYFGGKKSE